MKNKIVVVAIVLLTGIVTHAQKYFTKNGMVTFVSNAPIEDIESKNKSVASVLDVQAGTLQFSVLIKGFEFEKEEMQRHFNESYLESDKYPKSEFKGTITNNSEINYNKPGTYTAKVKGQLTIHGITRNIESTGTITVDGANLHTTATFNIKVADFNISIPSLVKNRVAKTVKVNVDCDLNPLK